MGFWNLIGEFFLFHWLFSSHECHESRHCMGNSSNYLFGNNIYEQEKESYQSDDDFLEEQEDYDMMDDF